MVVNITIKSQKKLEKEMGRYSSEETLWLNLCDLSNDINIFTYL